MYFKMNRQIKKNESFVPKTSGQEYIDVAEANNSHFLIWVMLIAIMLILFKDNVKNCIVAGMST